MIYRQKLRKPKSTKMAAKTKSNMKNRLRGFVFCTFWFFSIIAGFFLLVCPILPLVIISPKRYRKWSDVIFGMWEPFPVAMMEVCFGIRVVLSGDKINPFEGSLFVMNHRTRVDWNFLWLGLFHCCQPNAHNMKYVLKAPIMHIPGPGWVMQTCSFIFVHRNWAKDRPLLDKMLDYLNESDSLYQILLFPEGTDLTEKSIRKSHKFADEHNLERYHRVLHPRTTGFAFLANKMKSELLARLNTRTTTLKFATQKSCVPIFETNERKQSNGYVNSIETVKQNKKTIHLVFPAGGQLKAIYDVTVAYPKTMPLSEVDLFRGKFPEEVHFHVKRYSSSNIPFDEEELRSWLNNIWHEKEKKLDEFYTTGSFSKHDLSNPSDEKIDFGKMSMENGEIKFNYGELCNNDPNSNRKEISVRSVTSTSNSKVSIEPGTSGSPNETNTLTFTKSKECVQNYINCEEVYRSKNYRPSHLLYLVLVFWITLIIFIIHQLIYNFYVQLWVLTHALFFSALSLVSNGFHQVAASVYFYRYERKPALVKKSE